MSGKPSKPSSDPRSADSTGRDPQPDEALYPAGVSVVGDDEDSMIGRLVEDIRPQRRLKLKPR